MLPDFTVPVPASLMALLGAFRPLFTAPSFRTFSAGRRVPRPDRQPHVCGMLTGAGLSKV